MLAPNVNKITVRIIDELYIPKMYKRYVYGLRLDRESIFSDVHDSVRKKSSNDL